MADRYKGLDLNNKLIWNFRDIGHTLHRISEGKGSQKRILIILYETGGITQRELTEWLGIQPGSASEVIGKLEAADLIRRMPSASDHRTTELTLTEEGRKLAREAAGQREERHRNMFSCLSEKEKEILLGLVERINRDWDRKYRKKAEQ